MYTIEVDVATNLSLLLITNDDWAVVSVDFDVVVDDGGDVVDNGNEDDDDGNSDDNIGDFNDVDSNKNVSLFGFGLIILSRLHFVSFIFI